MSRYDPVRVVMFAAEVFPFAKVGGLADVVGALAKRLDRLGANVTLVMPAYRAIHHDKHGIRPYEPVPGFDLPMGSEFARAEIFHTLMEGSKIEVFFVGCLRYFYRQGIYDDPLWKEAYADNMERFIFFMKAGLELIGRLERRFDVIHCHDWQTGLVPGLLRTTLKDHVAFSRTGTLFTLHNVAYQGIFPHEALYWAGIDSQNFFPLSPFEFWGQVNFLKAGIECSDLVNTVSETYAREIQTTSEYGFGLEGVLHQRAEVLSGIVNGIDYEEWNPESDQWIPGHFSIQDLSGKSKCKKALLESFGLPQSVERRPLIGIVSRLVDQKGFDLIEESIEEITRLDIQMIVLGIGQPKYQDLFRRLATLHPQKISAKIGFDQKLAHLVEAGSDMFLMPSRYEPCGLSQLYSLRYGTVPIVRATGGLTDTVINYDLYTDTGTGFSFTNYSAQEMLIAVKRALNLFSDPQRWHDLVVRGMSQNWSWERSAEKYLELYQKVRRKNAGPPESPGGGPPQARRRPSSRPRAGVRKGERTIRSASPWMQGR